MPSATAFFPDLTPYFKLDGSRTITGPSLLALSAGNAAFDALTIRGAAAQSGDLLVLQSNTPADLVAWSSGGRHTAALTIAGVNGTPRYATDYTLTLTGSNVQTIGAARFEQTLALGQALSELRGVYSAIIANGNPDYTYGTITTVNHVSAGATSEMYGQYAIIGHSGAGLLGFQAGFGGTSSASGPTTTHAGLFFDATTSAANTNTYGALIGATNTGTISNTLYGARIAATQSSGSAVNVIGLDVVVSGAGSTATYALRTAGGTSLFQGNILQDGTRAIIGGTGTTSNLTLQSTTGAGATSSGVGVLVKVGSNGATTAITVLNNGKVGIGESFPRAALAIGDDNGYLGGLFVKSVSGSIANFGGVLEITTGIGPTTLGQGIRVDGTNRRIQFIASSAITADNEAFELDAASSNTLFNGPTSLDKTFFRIAQEAEFKPTSGTATLSWLKVIGLVNQTGGANGITRGLWITTDITAAADWRSLEITPNTGYAIYQSGASAENYFAGDVGIKTLVPNNALDVTGTVQADGLRLDVTPTAEVIVPTHTITISVNGTSYKIPIVAV
jgi:hypothetical protein